MAPSSIVRLTFAGTLKFTLEVNVAGPMTIVVGFVIPVNGSEPNVCAPVRHRVSIVPPEAGSESAALAIFCAASAPAKLQTLVTPAPRSALKERFDVVTGVG